MRPLDPYDGAARHVEAVLGLSGASLADVYRASAAFTVPCLGGLSDVLGETGHRRFGEVIAAEYTHLSATAALLHREMIFHDVVLELGGNETLAVLGAVLHRVADDALPRLAALASPAAVVDGGKGRIHREVVRLVEAGRARDAELLAHRWTLQVEAVLRADRLAGAPLRDLLL